MEFRKLVDGECGQQSVLTQLSSHLTQDYSRNEYRNFPNQQVPSSGLNSDQMVQEFLQSSYVAPQTFRMDQLLQEMREIENQSQITGPVIGPTVKETLHLDEWSRQYINSNFNKRPIEDSSIPANSDLSWIEQYSNFDHNALPAQISNYNQYNGNNGLIIEELTSENEEKSDYKQIAKEVVNVMKEDEKFTYSEFLNFMKEMSGDEVLDIKTDQNNVAASERWAQEYSQKFDEFFDLNGNVPGEQQVDEDLSKQFREEWEKVLKKSDENLQPWLDEYNESNFGEYQFNENNPLKEESNAFELGKQKLAENNLPLAVLYFEAAVLQNQENAEAWKLLGTTQAKNEQDVAAIAALKRSLSLNPGDLTSLFSLAVCYTNENYQNHACMTLIEWLKNNEKYSKLVPDNFKDFANYPPWSSIMTPEQHNSVVDLFLKAVHLNPNQIDSDVQSCLGVLFNLSGEYDKAIDCFRAALQVNKNDYEVWNRLGATLANGGFSEEAFEAYHQSLLINPGFIRARYNIAISCINMKAYKSAAEHLLVVLNQQAKAQEGLNEQLSSIQLNSGSQISEAVWNTLRLSINLMGNSLPMPEEEISQLIDNRMLDKITKIFEITDFEG